MPIGAAYPGKEFPRTGTIFQWYEMEEFEAYRHLGYLMGWAYLANVDFSEAELQPNLAARSYGRVNRLPA